VPPAAAMRRASAKAVFEAVLPSIKEQVLKDQVENYLKSIKDAGN
ncbi:MAG: hypothetical protein IMZ54_04055, partial [Acidobacteria bacterium]|nr:hypothetical protein [Acidobacteriota bacterium]